MLLHLCLLLAYTNCASSGKNAKTVSTHFQISRLLSSLTALFTRFISWLCSPKSRMLSLWWASMDGRVTNTVEACQINAVDNVMQVVSSSSSPWCRTSEILIHPRPCHCVWLYHRCLVMGFPPRRPFRKISRLLIPHTSSTNWWCETLGLFPAISHKEATSAVLSLATCVCTMKNVKESI